MQNQLIPTEELEMLVNAINNRLDALELQVEEAIERECSILIHDKFKVLENVQNQCNKINDMINRNSGQKKKQSALIIQPKYSV